MTDPTDSPTSGGDSYVADGVGVRWLKTGSILFVTAYELEAQRLAATLSAMERDAEHWQSEAHALESANAALRAERDVWKAETEKVNLAASAHTKRLLTELEAANKKAALVESLQILLDAAAGAWDQGEDEKPTLRRLIRAYRLLERESGGTSALHILVHPFDLTKPRFCRVCKEPESTITSPLCVGSGGTP